MNWNQRDDYPYGSHSNTVPNGGSGAPITVQKRTPVRLTAQRLNRNIEEWVPLITAITALVVAIQGVVVLILPLFGK